VQSLSQPVDMARLQHIRLTAGRVKNIVELDCFYLPTPVVDEAGDRPFYPLMMLAAEHDSGFVFPSEMMHPDQLVSRLAETFLHLIEQINVLPDIQVKRRDVYTLLEPIVSGLGIKLKLVKSLPALESAKQSLLEFMT